MSPDELRAAFERMARDSFDFKRSRKGTYFNPAVARDWKWFQLGAQTASPVERAFDIFNDSGRLVGLQNAFSEADAVDKWRRIYTGYRRTIIVAKVAS